MTFLRRVTIQGKIKVLEHPYLLVDKLLAWEASVDVKSDMQV
jgi:hypothetical protein